jgi:hypothetical protein
LATGKEMAAMKKRRIPLPSVPTGPASLQRQEDKTARIWDAATAREIAVLRGCVPDARGLVT